MKYLTNIAIAIDQFVNTLLGGTPDETLSARAWRQQSKTRWFIACIIIDLLFFWQINHCKQSYNSERQRKHLPLDYRS